MVKFHHLVMHILKMDFLSTFYVLRNIILKIIIKSRLATEQVDGRVS